MAGGGSVLTLGLMMMFGIDPAIANGTNRIGIIFGTGSAAYNFHKNKIQDIKQSIIFSLFAIPGAILGSIYSIEIDSLLFKKIFAILILLILISILLNKRKNEEFTKNSWLIYPFMIIVGLYGGFIQAGVGFLLIYGLNTFYTSSLLKTNMYKVFIVLLYTLPVLLVFGTNGKINWIYALFLASGNILGSSVSVKLAVKKGEKFAKIVLTLAIIAMAIKFWFYA